MDSIPVKNNTESPRILFFFKRIFPWPFLLLGLAMMTVGTRNWLHARASTYWPTTEGRNEVSKADPDTDGVYFARVSYSYEVAGTKHQSDRVAFGDYGSSDTFHAQEIVSRYPIGNQVKVFYEPANPSNAVLEPGLQPGVCFILLAGTFFATVGSLMLWVGFQDSWSKK